MSPRQVFAGATALGGAYGLPGWTQTALPPLAQPAWSDERPRWASDLMVHNARIWTMATSTSTP